VERLLAKQTVEIKATQEEIKADINAQTKTV
jgi:hypothetical protein